MNASGQAGIGTAQSVLVIIRGNSGSGKSTIARQVRSRHGERGVALVEQDYLRRILLRELDVPGGCAPQLISTVVTFALDHGYHVILEGILHSARHADMLHRLVAAHRGRSHVFYLDVDFDETVRRHADRPQASEFTVEQMRGWYVARDLLGTPGEQVIPQTWTVDESIAFIADATGLRAADGQLPAGRLDRSGS
jgi:adenylate kinase family enzyme